MSLCYTIYAIEGQQPTPRFLPPDFSIEEEHVTFPGDLIGFFRTPFEQYLMTDSSRIHYTPKISLSTNYDFIGNLKLLGSGVYLNAMGCQSYIQQGYRTYRSRDIDFIAGYADMILDRYPAGIFANAGYQDYRGSYNPLFYNVDVDGSFYLPLNNYLASAKLKLARENWKQQNGPYEINELYDMPRVINSNIYCGSIDFRGMPTSKTGFEFSAEVNRSINYRPQFWERRYQVISGLGRLVYDSKNLGITLGGKLFKTWDENIWGPEIGFSIKRKNIYFNTLLECDVKSPRRLLYDFSPRVAIPEQRGYLKQTGRIIAEGYLVLKPGQVFYFDARTWQSSGEPFIENPLAEVPKVVFEDISHEEFRFALSNDFGSFGNLLALEIKHVTWDETQIPIVPTRTITDTFTLRFGDRVSAWISGRQRVGLPDIGDKDEDDFSVGAEYNWEWISAFLLIENIFEEPIFNIETLDFDDQMKIWCGVELNF